MHAQLPKLVFMVECRTREFFPAPPLLFSTKVDSGARAYRKAGVVFGCLRWWVLCSYE
jgi:hypothetical protein